MNDAPQANLLMSYISLRNPWAYIVHKLEQKLGAHL